MANETFEQQITPEHAADQARIAELETENAELKAEVETLRRLAFTDSLTELLNRRGLEQEAKILLPEKHVEGAERRSTQEKKNIGVLCLDIDHFKEMNDESGDHSEGDRILVEAAAFLKKHMRGNDIVARLGGDEFVVILHDVDPEKFMEKISDPEQENSQPRLGFTTTFKGEEVSINFSGGLTMLQDHETIDDLPAALKRADTALYQAKRGDEKDGQVNPGRNRIVRLAFDGNETEK